MLIFTLSLHDALPISAASAGRHAGQSAQISVSVCSNSISLAEFSTHSSLSCPGALLWVENSASEIELLQTDRKSTRLNSSHRCISYAVFCLKKKKIQR